MAKDSIKKVAGETTYRRSKRLLNASVEPYPSPREVADGNGSDPLSTAHEFGDDNEFALATNAREVGDAREFASGDSNVDASTTCAMHIVREFPKRECSEAVEDASPFVESGNGGFASVSPGSLEHRLRQEMMVDDNAEDKMANSAIDGSLLVTSGAECSTSIPARSLAHGMGHNEVATNTNEVAVVVQRGTSAALEVAAIVKTPSHPPPGDGDPPTGSSLSAPFSTPQGSAFHPPLSTPPHRGSAQGSEISALSAPPVYGRSPVPFDDDTAEGAANPAPDLALVGAAAEGASNLAPDLALAVAAAEGASNPAPDLGLVSAAAEGATNPAADLALVGAAAEGATNPAPHLAPFGAAAEGGTNPAPDLAPVGAPAALHPLAGAHPPPAAHPPADPHPPVVLPEGISIFDIDAASAAIIARMALISVIELDCEELEKFDNACRLHANHAYGRPGANNGYYNFRRKLIRRWINGAYIIHIVPSLGNSSPVPMVLMIPCKMVESRAAPLDGGGLYSMQMIQPGRGFGPHNHRLCLGVQMAIDRLIMDRLLISIGEAVGAVPRFRDFDLRSNCTILTATEWLKPGTNRLANLPTPASRLFDYNAATVLTPDQ
ncbi:hypothetical protein HDU96_010189, partial [Phlyctochytrium bullatum]